MRYWNSIDKIAEYNHKGSSNDEFSVVAHLYKEKIYYQCGANKYFTKKKILGYAHFYYCTNMYNYRTYEYEFIKFTNWIKFVERKKILEELLG